MEFIFVFIFGVIWGSFGGVLIYRIPKNMSLLMPFSFCELCGKNIAWKDKIPILSYLLLSGKCRWCQRNISFWCCLDEIFGGLFALFSFYFYGIYGLFCFFLCLFFYILCRIDWDFLMIPNALNFLTLFLGVGCGVVSFRFDIIEVLHDGLLLIGVASFLRLFLESLLDKEVMGEGDIIVFGTLGAALGMYHAFVAIFISSLLALIFMIFKRMGKAPFVPFLFLGFLWVFAVRNMEIF
ncbi:MAG: prepilin peptidase [Helicobacter sp.]|nr:prepilin peptidase [Helicobacter sp.]